MRCNRSCTLILFLQKISSFMRGYLIYCSLLSTWFRLVYAAIFGDLLVNLLEVSHILSNPVYLKAFGAEQLNAQVILLLNTFNNGWDVSFLIFGLHLFVLA
ncbi:DUF4386 family protein [Iocasia frigidifontis]|uniref:DUF4386 family protein n=1 Tax=Iocasia fonsfrigidae TaxID=2682810 RepID=UPI001E43AAD7|nr:DUF4386 family protein [Iocasia fonsfrigidae]